MFGLERTRSPVLWRFFNISRAQDKRVRHAWLPDPEDLDLPSAPGTPTHKDMQAAQLAFGLMPNGLSCTGYAKIFDEFSR